MEIVKDGKTFAIASKDRVPCMVGLKLLGKAVSAALKATKRVGCEAPAVVIRFDECKALKEHFHDIGPKGDGGIRFDHCATLRAALTLHYDAVVAVAKSKKALELDDDAESTRQKQLGRLLSALDVAGFAAPVADEAAPAKKKGRQK